MEKVSTTFMAFASGKESTDGATVKRYTGVAPVYVIEVNPNKEELEKIYNTQIENAPEYVGEIDVNGTKVPNVRIDFVVKTDANKSNGIEMITKVSFFIRKEFRINRDKTKVQVIDKYGRTAWVTNEQYKNKEIPMYSNGPANIDKDYRACYYGEEDLTNFIKAYLNIPNVMKYINGTWVMNDNPADSEARLESIEKYFNGDFSEIKGAIALQPNNKVKVLFGVRTTDDNKQYQTAYTQMVLKNSVSDYSQLDADVAARKAQGAFATTEFIIGDLKEYNIEATNFSSSPATSNPFTENNEDPWGFNV